MSATLYLLLAALLPLITFVGLLALGRRLGRFAGPVASALAFASVALSVAALILFVSRWVDKPGAVQPYALEAFTYRWISLPAPASADYLAPAASTVPQAITIGVLVDSLTVACFLLVTFIVALVHLFLLSTSDPRLTRSFAFLNLLSFSMLGLLLANSLVQLFIFWQLLGIATYFLMNVHVDRRVPVTAAFRAFIINRVSDAAFLLALGLLVAHAQPGFPALSLFDAQGTSILSESIRGTLGIRASAFLVYPGGGFLGLHWLTWTGVLFMLAILLRAAQFPFYWIRDLAETPAPLAAVLQTCTTLAAGVYLLARLYPILTLDARFILAVVSCASLALAALFAAAQSDFRRLLAWTSVSQFALMLLFLACGGYTAGLLQLITHAFPKAALLLALAALPQSLPKTRWPGSLWKRFPVTALGSLLAVLALAGTPLLSVAYSTNMGLADVYQYASALHGHGVAGAVGGVGGRGADEPFATEMLLFWIPTVALYVIAFALGRCWWMLFVSPAATGTAGQTEKAGVAIPAVRPAEEPHESAMATLPLIILAGFTLAVLFEFLSIPLFLSRSLAPTVAAFVTSPSDAVLHTVSTLTALAPACVVLAFAVYLTGPSLARRLVRLPGVNLLYLYLHEGLFLEALLDLAGAFVLLLIRLAGLLDRYVLGGTLRILAFATEALAHLVARLDVSLDRPVKTAALLLAPHFRDVLPPETPGFPMTQQSPPR